jgi:hypothetical protein
MEVTMRKRLVALAVVALAVSTVGAAGHRLLGRIAVPGDYGWDYAGMDREGRRLYVGHDREVVVIDLDTDRVFTADRGDQQVTAIDAKTGKVACRMVPLRTAVEHCHVAKTAKTS